MATLKGETITYVTIHFNDKAESGYGDFSPATEETVLLAERVGPGQTLFDVMRDDETVASYRTYDMKRVMFDGVECIGGPVNESAVTYFGAVWAIRDLKLDTHPDLNPDGVLVATGRGHLPEAKPGDRVFDRATGAQVWPPQPHQP